MKKLTNKITHFNTQRGITLVALVITIIVLLILAGVAINMAINSDGLFGKANEATEKWNESVEKEETAISDLLTELDKVSPMAVEISTDIPTGWDSTKVSAVATAGSRKAPIPIGFTVSAIEGENTIGKGLVIYQTENAEITANFWTEQDENNNNFLKCQTTYNQFVWIPVDDINSMVMCKNNNKNATVTDTNTEEVCNLKLEKDTEGNDTLRCMTHNPTGDNTTELCGRLYGTDTNSSTIPYTTSMDFSDRTQTWYVKGFHEPDIVSTYDVDDTQYIIQAGILSGKVADFEKQMKDDFINMAISVAKYGGFYVSRYEAGENGASKRNQIVITAGVEIENPTVYQGVDSWYGLYKTVKSSTPVSTHMIYGSQYDQIINFIGAEAQKGHTGRVVTSQSKTGTKETDRLNNIYDLEGNNFEWTAQVNWDKYRVGRGGVHYHVSDNGKFLPASHRYASSPTTTSSNASTRLSLYL